MLLTSRSVKKHSTVPLKLLLREGRWGGGGETQFSVKAQKGRERVRVSTEKEGWR